MKKYLYIISAVPSIILMSCFGFYYELYEPIGVNIAAGTFCDPPYHLWITTVHMFLFPIYAMLYHLFPSLGVMGIFESLLTLLSLLVLTYFIQGLLKKTNISPLAQIALITIISLILLSDSLILLNATRISVLLMLGPLLILLYDSRSGEKIRNAFLYTLIFFACLMRLQTAIATLLLTCVFAIYLRRHISARLNTAIPAVLIAVILSLVYTLDRAGTTDPAKKIENQYEYAILDSHSFVGEDNMQTQVDTLKYRAVTNFMLNDSAVLMTGFVNRVLENHPYIKHPDRIMPRMSETTILLLNFAHRHIDKLLLILLLIVLSIALSADRLPILWAHLSITATLILVLVCATFFINMYDRIFATTLVIGGVFHFILFIRTVPERPATAVWTALILLFILPCTWLHLCEIHGESTSFHNKYLALDKELHGKTQKYIICIGINSLIFNNKSPEQPDQHVMSRLILSDFGYIDYYSFLRDKYLREEQFNVTDFASIADFIQRERKNIIIYGSADRVKLFSQYLSIVHHINLTFRQSGKAVSLNTDEPYYYYEVANY
jgi:hypothetical protein